MKNIKNRVPQVRFPEFKDEWKHKKLNELLSVSKTKNTDLKFTKEEVLSVSGELGIVNQIEHLGRSYAGESVKNYGVVELNQIVYTKSPLKANPYGIIKLNKHKPGIVSTLYAVYDVNKKSDGLFIEYYFSLDANLNRYLRPLVRKGAKNDMKISNEYVLNDHIYSPSLPEQKRIAHFFTTLDIKIKKLEEKKSALEEYKKGMMQKLFSQEIRFKDEDGNDYPNWEEKKLGEVCEINPKNNILPEQFIYIDLESVEKGRLVKENQINLSIAPSRAQRLLSNNDVLFQMVRPYQQNHFHFSNDKSIYVASTGFAQLRTKNHSLFLFQLINSASFNKKVITRCTGTSYPAINSNDLARIKINIPQLNEQKRIANFLSKIDYKLNTVNQQIERTKEYKKGLLQKMFVN